MQPDADDFLSLSADNALEHVAVPLAPMPLQFDYILASVGIRPFKVYGYAFINGLPLFIVKWQVVSMPRCERGIEQLLDERAERGAGDADDSDASASWSRSDGDNGVCMCVGHGLWVLLKVEDIYCNRACPRVRQYADAEIT